jgi:hypothetical protein
MWLQFLTVFINRCILVFDEDPSELQNIASSKSKINTFDNLRRSQNIGNGKVFLTRITTSDFLASFSVLSKFRMSPVGLACFGMNPLLIKRSKYCDALYLVEDELIPFDMNNIFFMECFRLIFLQAKIVMVF